MTVDIMLYSHQGVGEYSLTPVEKNGCTTPKSTVNTSKEKSTSQQLSGKSADLLMRPHQDFML